MPILASAWDVDAGEANPFYANGRLVNDGFDIETLIINLLASDAPAQDGDVLADQTPRRGWVFDVLDEDGKTLGSRLWLLEGAEVTEETAQRAVNYAKEALQSLIDDGYVSRFEYETELQDDDLALVVIATAADGRSTRIGPFRVVGA